MAAQETTIRETIRKHHRPSMSELYEVILNFRGPGKIVIHVGFGGSLQQYDVVTSEKEKSQPTPQLPSLQQKT